MKHAVFQLAVILGLAAGSWAQEASPGRLTPKPTPEGAREWMLSLSLLPFPGADGMASCPPLLRPTLLLSSLIPQNPELTAVFKEYRRAPQAVVRAVAEYHLKMVGEGDDEALLALLRSDNPCVRQLPVFALGGYLTSHFAQQGRPAKAAEQESLADPACAGDKATTAPRFSNARIWGDLGLLDVSLGGRGHKCLLLKKGDHWVFAGLFHQWVS
jgi:hypothetical protein